MTAGPDGNRAEQRAANLSDNKQGSRWVYCQALRQTEESSGTSAVSVARAADRGATAGIGTATGNSCDGSRREIHRANGVVVSVSHEQGAECRVESKLHRPAKEGVATGAVRKPVYKSRGAPAHEGRCEPSGRGDAADAAVAHVRHEEQARGVSGDVARSEKQCV